MASGRADNALGRAGRAGRIKDIGGMIAGHWNAIGWGDTVLHIVPIMVTACD